MKFILAISILLAAIFVNAWEFTKANYSNTLSASSSDGPGFSYSWTKRIVETIDGWQCVADHSNRTHLLSFSNYTEILDWQDCRAIIDAKEFRSALGHACNGDRNDSYSANDGISNRVSSQLVLTNDCICRFETSGGPPFKGYSRTEGVNPFQCFEMMSNEERALARKLVQPKPAAAAVTTKAQPAQPPQTAAPIEPMENN